MKLKIKVGDEVQVVTGSDKGKKGAVLELLPLKQKIRVKDVRVQTKFDKEKGIQKIEGFIDYSNVRLIKAGEPKAYKKSKKDSKKRLLKK
ncbi:MAG: KOW motif domain-containing protein [Oligoflexia bacterium]|nr:KOW motif domain-containing protein [Oligoflexia bacterium]